MTLAKGTQVITKDQIVALLATNDKAIARALLVLNANQTADEQVAEDVKYQNGKGFRPCHARMGTSMAKFYGARGFLTPKQISYWRKPDAKGTMKIAIYWRQLMEAAEQKAAATVVEMTPILLERKMDAPDVGNLCEELIALEEQYNCDVDGDDFAYLERLQERMAMLRKEIARAHMETN
jgi:hypothetical protein